MVSRRKLFQLGTAAAISGPLIVNASEKKYRWRMVTTWPKNFPGLGTGANRLAELLKTLSQGRLQVKVFGAGELVPAMGVFDAVKRGTAQMGHCAAYYWKGKHEAAQFFAAVPFGMNAAEMNSWLHFGNGKKLWDEVYKPFGVQGFAAGNTGVQMAGWFNKEIKSVSDFKGLKMRMPGLGGEVLRKMGATVVTLPGGEIFQALKTNTIDATEWVGPYNDMAMGLHNAGKFYYWPGWHEPGTTLEALVNQKALESLPKDLQNVVSLACQLVNQEMLNEYTLRNSEALKTLTGQNKVKLKRLDDKILKELAKHSKEVVAEIAGKDPLTTKVYQDFLKFRESSAKYNLISEQGYSMARAFL